MAGGLVTSGDRRRPPARGIGERPVMTRTKGPAPVWPQSYEWVSSLKGSTTTNWMTENESMARRPQGHLEGPDRKARAGENAGVWVGTEDPGFPSRVFQDNTSVGTGHNTALS